MQVSRHTLKLTLLPFTIWAAGLASWTGEAPGSATQAGPCGWSNKFMPIHAPVRRACDSPCCRHACTPGSALQGPSCAKHGHQETSKGILQKERSQPRWRGRPRLPQVHSSRPGGSCRSRS